MSGRSEVLRRRALSVTAVLVGVIVGSLLFLPAVVLFAIADLIRGAWRLPLVRLSAFGLCWLWLEAIGVTVAAALWVTGRRGDAQAHYRLQRLWADRMLAALRVTCGVTIHVDGVSELHPAPVVVLVRHASLADSLLAVWAVTQKAQLNPRVVLKRELLVDPCLDVVGNRLPNCFIDREADDARAGLADIRRLGAQMDAESASVIFPEGTRTSSAKRQRALERIAQRDPARAERLAGLENLSPPRPAGTRALLDGARNAGAGVVVGWHHGFDGLDTFSGILAALARPRTPIELRFRRVPGPETLTDPGFTQWLDELWLQADQAVHELRVGDKAGDSA
jgi:1-acyl-sn-glycerol-3-phosphate acyltransferase